MEHSKSTTERFTLAGLNLIQQALSIYDADLRLVVSNARFHEMFDLPDHLVNPGASFSETIRFLTERGEYGDVEDIESFVKERVRTAMAFEPHYVERQRSNGQIVSIEGAPLPEGGWVAVYTDITQIKRQEALLRAKSETLSDQVLGHTEQLSLANRELAATNIALEQAKRELTAMEARTRLTTEMMPAHIAHLDLDGLYTYSNRRLSAVLPNRPNNILGLHMREALGEAAFEKTGPYLELAYKGEASVFEFTDSTSGRRIRVAFTPDIREGNVTGVYILSMDVTEETQARAALAQTRKKELAAQMTSGLAHDFANLLTIILGMQARLERMDLPEEARELVNATQGAARRGGVLLDKIGKMSAPRSMNPSPCNVADLLRDLAVLATPSLPDGVTLKTESTGLSEPLLLDAGSLQDSLLNLVLNARDAIGKATGEIHVTAKEVSKTWLVISVSDTGPGFSNEALSRGLEPFFTTKGGEGSGLGLSMVYDLTKLAGGQVELENHASGGRVTLRLPRRPVPVQSEPTMVLLVEDSPEIRLNVRDMLMELGHVVIEAETVGEACELAKLPGIGMILSDISLKGNETGIALLDRLSDAGMTVPAFLMTSKPESDPLFQEAAQRYRVIGKPFDGRELGSFLAAEDTA
ncbi:MULTISPECIES: PAS-domain containing protein [Halocynthiibacter]|uniref:histidine kinase n=1 Tax=Halocynthiibacter halioticoli TaxID=2986804 RepID=A0AAE3LUT6_9RHOB|nr:MULTISPECIES: PAS-domain containing protein [Halocynthiibacter]MCV6825750.1 PAS-domain containing protein [Halocynthiibacter halioticoli]MCW4058751.1 PAS-domain containing protein [Halocynthiibacter sp. SDUM655004]